MGDSATPPRHFGALEQEIIDVLGTRLGSTGLDHDLLWNGYLQEWSADAVRSALRRLRRHGYIEAMHRRGWYCLTDAGREKVAHHE